MAIDKIFERISSEADSAVEKLLDQAGEEAARIRSEYAARAADLEKQLNAYAEKKAGEQEKHLVVSEQLQLRKALLTEKRRILDGIYEDARKGIEDLPDERFLSIMRDMILGRAISGKEEIVVAGRQAGIVTDQFIEQLNKAFEGGGSFSLASDPGQFSWGVVLREGRRVVDLSLDVVFEQLKEKIEPRIAAILFP